MLAPNAQSVHTSTMTLKNAAFPAMALLRSLVDLLASLNGGVQRADGNP
jgi:hypothetical protein